MKYKYKRLRIFAVGLMNSFGILFTGILLGLTPLKWFGLQESPHPDFPYIVIIVVFLIQGFATGIAFALMMFEVKERETP